MTCLIVPSLPAASHRLENQQHPTSGRRRKGVPAGLLRKVHAVGEQVVGFRAGSSFAGIVGREIVQRKIVALGHPVRRARAAIFLCSFFMGKDGSSWRTNERVSTVRAMARVAVVARPEEA